MRLLERELSYALGDGGELLSKPTLTELQTRWLKHTRESWLLRKERLRDTVLVRTLKDKEKIEELKPFHGVAHVDDEGNLYISRWMAMSEIDDPGLYTVLWPKISEERMVEYLTHLPQSRPFLVRAQLARVSGVEKAIRLTDHVRKDYLPQEGERTLETRELVVQIRRLLTAYARSRDLTPRQIQDLTYETRNLIRTSGFATARLPAVQEAVGRVLRASDMKDQTGRYNPSACRQMLYSALTDLTKELELKHTQVQAKYAALKAVLEINRDQMRWTLSESKYGLAHFLKSAPYRQARSLATWSEKELVAVKKGMIANLRNICQELDSQIRLQSYRSVAQGIILGLQGGEKENYQAAGWRGDSAVELITNGYFSRAESRIKFCLRRINNVLEEYESIEKKEDEPVHQG
ncbi:hypothetical protein AMJ51_01440 [Microgenomates bacterium DG_75]|nr:MAG: hypothetical protein AMJ51_01440 [Microgenomates bacterium DG_75]